MKPFRFRTVEIDIIFDQKQRKRERGEPCPLLVGNKYNQRREERNPGDKYKYTTADLSFSIMCKNGRQSSMRLF